MKKKNIIIIVIIIVIVLVLIGLLFGLNSSKKDLFDYFTFTEMIKENREEVIVIVKNTYKKDNYLGSFKAIIKDKDGNILMEIPVFPDTTLKSGESVRSSLSFDKALDEDITITYVHN